MQAQERYRLRQQRREAISHDFKAFFKSGKLVNDRSRSHGLKVAESRSSAVTPSSKPTFFSLSLKDGSQLANCHLKVLGTSSSRFMPYSQHEAGGLVALLYTVPTSILARSKFGGKTLLSQPVYGLYVTKPCCSAMKLYYYRTSFKEGRFLHKVGPCCN